MNRKIIDYFMICANRASDLNSDVAMHISEGWQIYGIPYVQLLDANTPDNHLCYSQAMVKYET